MEGKELSRRLEELKAGKRALQSKQKALQAERLESYERYAAGKRAEEDGKAAGKRAEEGGKPARRRAEEGENAAGRSPGRDGSLAAEYQDSINRICAQEKETEALLADIEKDMDHVRTELSKKQDFAELLAYCGAAELTRETVRKFIRSIAVKDEQHIQITWTEVF